ncbi:hypothetical protein KC318_g4414 [Hortaea werneckii]|uniref:SET domain-containing protein n=1 Tax=Hortaea werneckii TaxID=91943 RepID=A0A3M7BLR6_HORWE|nr:hypothetical protein KC334_g4831 [Hortaea werneckii]KAI7017492.1 hypothetical protein KC355_g3652 [Hortaea werneckii]KAI7669806.1 hypothetical protein KC318_g4414 [Hortaea werneckii]RMY40497.1 hypothetical protein D0866_01232 [Hortaea werneckii]
MEQHALLASLTEKQRQWLRNAGVFEGLALVDKMSREDLSSLVDESADKRPGTGQQSFYSMPKAYAPSTTPAADLSPMTLSDLRLETRHTGKVLIVRTIGQPKSNGGVESDVEDEFSSVTQLAIYNTDRLLRADELLPTDIVFAVKEPYCEVTAGGACLRVDHPSDLVRVYPGDTLMPKGLHGGPSDLSKTPEDWKREGNAAYLAKSYPAAEEAYSQGLMKCSEHDDKVRCDLYRNRALVNIFLKRCDRALKDAKHSIFCQDEKLYQSVEDPRQASDAKAWYRAGRAAYELGFWIDARKYFERARALSEKAEREDAERQLERTAARIAEVDTAAYNFEAMGKSASNLRNRLDHASHVKHAEKGDAGDCGRGLFAKKAFKPGDLILCEKAFSTAHSDEEGSRTFAFYNTNTRSTAKGIQTSLLYNTVQKLLHNSSEANRFFDLYDGGYSPQCKAQMIDGVAAIDIFQTQAIIERNSFGFNSRISENLSENEVKNHQVAGNPSTGIWITASYMNHACDGNAARAFLGDMMLVRATKDIAKGQEILIPYLSPDMDHAVTLAPLQQQWSFTCHCAICTAETEVPQTQRDKRTALVKKAEQMLSQHDPDLIGLPDVLVVAEFEELYSRLKEIYDRKLFAKVPRIALVQLGRWLCQSCWNYWEPVKLAETAVGVLRDAGYGIAIVGQELKVDYTHCMILGGAVDGSIYAWTAYARQGERELAEQFKMLSVLADHMDIFVAVEGVPSASSMWYILK